jgi:uncharacterized protein
VVEEPESAALAGYLDEAGVFASSRLALVEVPRATSLANPSEEVRNETRRLLHACLLIAVSDRVLRDAAELTSREVRTLDAIHLSTALYIDADDFVAYDQRLLAAAATHGLSVVAPGLK